MRIILTLGAALALAACGGSETESSEANLAANDMMMDQNMAMDPMMNGTGNMAMDPMMNGTMNGAVDPATQNLIEQDMNTNSPDTNLANGL